MHKLSKELVSSYLRQEYGVIRGVFILFARYKKAGLVEKNQLDCIEQVQLRRK